MYNDVKNVNLSSNYDIDKFIPSYSIILSTFIKLLDTKRSPKLLEYTLIIE